MRSMGWMTSVRARTMSPALMLEGTRSLTRPMSDMLLPAAAADGDLHLALGLQQGAVALLGDGPHVRRLAQPHGGSDIGLAGLWRQGHARDDGDAVFVGHDVDVLDVALSRH